MIDVVEIYEDFVTDDANKDQNGSISYSKFNRMLWRAELALMGWLTGNPTDVNPPEKISTQKARDLLSVFIKKYPVQVTNGSIDKPEDYYSYRSLYRIIGQTKECEDLCEGEDPELRIVRSPIELLDNSKFTARCSTAIQRLKPEVKPIAKLSADDTFEFAPEDIGSVVLEYYRYPKQAKIVTMRDNVYNQDVPNPAFSVDLEWSAAAKPYLLYSLSKFFSLHVREASFQQQNELARTP